jgi:hypothetical protein
MNWQAWFARDALLWQVLFCVGLLASALAAVTDPTLYGIPASWMPYVRLVAFVAAVIGGKFGMSPVPLERNMGGGQ